MVTNAGSQTTGSQEAGESLPPAGLYGVDVPDFFETVGLPSETTEDSSGKTLNSNQGQKSQEGKSAADKDVGETDGQDAKEEDESKIFGRLDKHPRFQELIQKNQRLEEEIKELKEALLGGKKPEDAAKKAEEETAAIKKFFEYEDVSEWKPETILEKFSESPHEFLSNFASQVANEVLNYVEVLLQQKETEKKKEAEIDRTYQQFAQENPDFIEKWESGEISRFLKKNPGHTAISAYLVLTAKDREKAIEERIRQELEKEKERKQTELAAKYQSRTLRPGSAGGAASSLATGALKDTTKQGGLINALASTLREMRRNSP